MKKEDDSRIYKDQRRKVLSQLVAGTGLMALGLNHQAQAHKPTVDEDTEKEERFPGDPPEHFIVFPFNHAEAEYHDHVLGSVGAMIAKYEDNIDQVVVCFGPGIHLLAKNPRRPVSKKIISRVKSLAKQGVKFHACARTLSTFNWDEKDLYSFVTIVDVGAADIMELQEQNYALMVW